MPVDIRPAAPGDVPAIAAIYGHAVRTSVATFDTEDPPTSYWHDRVTATGRGNHTLVLEDTGQVVGYAYSAPFRARAAYAFTRETSIYLAPGAIGRGSGRRAYSRLLHLLQDDGIHCAVAVVAQPNAASNALHESLGYREIGVLREVGRKFDRWVDTSFYQLML